MPFNPCCDDIIGGLILIEASFASGGNKSFEGMGEIRIQPFAVAKTSGATSYGHVWVTEQARPIRILMSYANRCSNNPMDLFRGRCKIHLTLYEISRGFVHELTDALVSGDAELNLSTGELSGVELICSWDQYETRQEDIGERSRIFDAGALGVQTIAPGTQT